MKLRIQVILVLIALFQIAGFASASEIAIIESQSINPMFTMDEHWQTVAAGMGHNATIQPQEFLDDPANILTTDLLIISSATITLPEFRRTMIREYLKSGVPVYLQCEYDPSFASNQLFEDLVITTGTNFMWSNQRFTSLTPMQITGDLATALNTVYSIDVFLYGVTAIGGFNLVGNMEFGGEEFGWFYDPPNNSFGFLASNTDRNWILMDASPALMENYIYYLLNDTVTSGEIVFTNVGPSTIPAAGGALHAMAQVLNPTNSPLNVDAWTRMILPNGSYYGPLMVQANRWFPVGYVSPERPVNQVIPWYAPAGTYTFEAVLGNLFMNTVYAVDGFQFEKLATGIDGAFDNWDSDGFNFETAPVLASSGTAADGMPESFELGEAYPNPFNPSTSMELSLPVAGNVQVNVYNVMGQQVATLVDGQMTAGVHMLTLNADGLSSGVYFVRADLIGQSSQVRKVMLAR